MKKVLFYVEPHPIRNYFNEFTTPATIFYDIACHPKFKGIDWRIFSNSFVLKEMVDTIINNVEQNNASYYDLTEGIDKNDFLEKIRLRQIFPDSNDENIIRSFLHEWNEDEILLRNELVLGQGDLSFYYEKLLTEIYKDYNFTEIVLWSENGAVRNFASKMGINVIHMELGPTRLPFQETMLIDPLGTNANASICRSLRPKFCDLVHSALWMSDFSTRNNISVQEMILNPGIIIEAENRHGVLSITTDYISPLSFESQPNKAGVTFIEKYVIISLQLTDDLNTINHSEFVSPKDFLKKLVPNLLLLGFNVLIKRHPGSVLRIYNFIKEIEAIEYAKSISDKVFILPFEMTQKEFILTSKNATAVLSINSSVSFESWIIGVPGLIYGNAVFDIDAKLLKLSKDFLNGGDLINDTALKNSIKENVEFSLNHYFIPRNRHVMSACLAEIINNFDFKGQSNFPEWIAQRINFFSLLLEDKLSVITNKISKTTNIDLHYAMLIARANKNFYKINIDEFCINNGELILRGWAISEITEATIVFVEYKGNVFISNMTERPDVKQHYPYASEKSGFNLREVLEVNDKGPDKIKLYVYGKDFKCRYMEVKRF